jgi:hypothetical protein
VTDVTKLQERISENSTQAKFSEIRLLRASVNKTRQARELVKGHRAGGLGFPPSTPARARGTLPLVGRGRVFGPRGC